MGTKKKNKKTLFGFTMLFAAVVFIFQVGMPNKTYGINRNKCINIQQEPYISHILQQPDSVSGGIKVYNINTVEQKPDFPGGPMEFYKYLAENTEYPDYALDHQIQGTVWVQFIIDKQGNVTNVKVIKSVHPILDEEAVKVVKSMPKWKPGIINGEPVDVEFTVPIIFKLD